MPRLYEAIKKINLKHKFRLASRDLPVGKLLDIGCGVGDFLHIAEHNGWQCTGVEPSEEAREIARQRIKGDLLYSEDLNHLPDQSFDLITMWHVLEHVDDLKWQVAQLQRLIKPNGRIVIAVPNYRSYDGRFYNAYWAAYDVPRHLNHFNRTVITKIFKTSGLSLVSMDKLVWDAYYISFMSEQYKHHFMPLVRGVFRGLVSNAKARRSGEWSSLVYVFRPI